MTGKCKREVEDSLISFPGARKLFKALAHLRHRPKLRKSSSVIGRIRGAMKKNFKDVLGVIVDYHMFREYLQLFV